MPFSSTTLIETHRRLIVHIQLTHRSLLSAHRLSDCLDRFSFLGHGSPYRPPSPPNHPPTTNQHRSRNTGPGGRTRARDSRSRTVLANRCRLLRNSAPATCSHAISQRFNSLRPMPVTPLKDPYTRSLSRPLLNALLHKTLRTCGCCPARAGTPCLHGLLHFLQY